MVIAVCIQMVKQCVSQARNQESTRRTTHAQWWLISNMSLTTFPKNRSQHGLTIVTTKSKKLCIRNGMWCRAPRTIHNYSRYVQPDDRIHKSAGMQQMAANIWTKNVKLCKNICRSWVAWQHPKPPAYLVGFATPNSSSWFFLNMSALINSNIQKQMLC